MISTFQRNRHFRKVSVNKTFTHVQEQKKAMSPRHSTHIPSSVKSLQRVQVRKFCHIAEKIKFSTKSFFSKCEPISRNLWICSYYLKKSLTENFIFCAGINLYIQLNYVEIQHKKYNVLCNKLSNWSISVLSKKFPFII